MRAVTFDAKNCRASVQLGLTRVCARLLEARVCVSYGPSLLECQGLRRTALLFHSAFLILRLGSEALYVRDCHLPLDGCTGR